MNRATGTTSWVAVGARAVAGCRGAAAPGVPVESAPDVHAALLALAMDGRRPVLVESDALLPRPRAALRALRAAAAPEEVVVLVEPGIPADARALRAAVALGIRCASSLADASTPTVKILPAAAVVREAASSSAIPRADEAKKASPRTMSLRAFVDGCFRRLDRPEALSRFVVKCVAEASGAARVSLLLLDPTRTSLFAKAAKGLEPGLIGRLRVPIASGLAGRAASLGRAVSGHASSGGERGYVGTAYAILPLGRGSACEGVVTVTDLPGDRLPDAKQLPRLLRIAVRAGRALSAARRLEHAETLSATDDLTALPNRRAFERALHRELERARRAGGHLAVAILDVDHFKAVNDRFGHEVGDRVLAEVARRLAQAFRETDLVCRFGGEEFAVLLTALAEGTAAEALTVLERARRAVSERPLALGPGYPCPMITVSGGVVSTVLASVWLASVSLASGKLSPPPPHAASPRATEVKIRAKR